MAGDSRACENTLFFRNTSIDFVHISDQDGLIYARVMGKGERGMGFSIAAGGFSFVIGHRPFVIGEEANR